VLTLHGASLPERLERNLDATALGGPVTMLSSYRAPRSGEVKIVASTRPGTPDSVEAARARSPGASAVRTARQGQATQAAAKAGAAPSSTTAIQRRA